MVLISYELFLLMLLWKRRLNELSNVMDRHWGVLRVIILSITLAGRKLQAHESDSLNRNTLEIFPVTSITIFSHLTGFHIFNSSCLNSIMSSLSYSFPVSLITPLGPFVMTLFPKVAITCSIPKVTCF